MFVKANQRMLWEIINELNQPAASIDPFLSDIVEQGFLHQDGLVLLKSLYNPDSISMRASLHDDVGFECFVNHIHISKHNIANSLSTCVVFMKKIGEIWKTSEQARKLRSILSANEDDYTIRFHVLREGEEWLDEDLESYDEDAVLVIDF